MRTAMLAAALLLAAPALAQQQLSPAEGGPQPGQAQSGPSAGPARQPPQDDTPQTRSRGSDGSVAGLTEPGATGASPQGMLGNTTTGQGEPLQPGSGPLVPLPPRSDPRQQP